MAAYELRESSHLGPDRARQLEELLSWFRENLIVPDKFNRSTSKGAHRRKTKGVAWFKDTSREHISRARELASLLEEHGHSIDIIKTDLVGYIVYEDDVQVIAEPFAETPT